MKSMKIVRTTTLVSESRKAPDTISLAKFAIDFCKELSAIGLTIQNYEITFAQSSDPTWYIFTAKLIEDNI